MKERSMFKSMMLVGLGVIIGSGISTVSSSPDANKEKARSEAAMPPPPSGPYQSTGEKAPLYPPMGQATPPWAQRTAPVAPPIVKEPNWSALRSNTAPSAPRLQWPTAPVPDWNKRPQAPQRPAWATAPQRPEWAQRPERPDWAKRPEPPKRPEWTRQPQRPDWAQRPERPERPEWAKRPERPEWAKRPERPEWAKRPERPEWAKRPEPPKRPEWAKRPEAPKRPEWVERSRGQWLNPPQPQAWNYGYGYPQPYGMPWSYAPGPRWVQPGR